MVTSIFFITLMSLGSLQLFKFQNEIICQSEFWKHSTRVMTKNLTSTPLALTPSWLKLCQTTIFSSHHQTSLRPFKMSWNLKGKLGYAK